MNNIDDIAKFANEVEDNVPWHFLKTFIYLFNCCSADNSHSISKLNLKETS
jgi:hypothetical protein